MEKLPSDQFSATDTVILSQELKRPISLVDEGGNIIVCSGIDENVPPIDDSSGEGPTEDHATATVTPPEWIHP